MKSLPEYFLAIKLNKSIQHSHKVTIVRWVSWKMRFLSPERAEHHFNQNPGWHSWQIYFPRYQNEFIYQQVRTAPYATRKLRNCAREFTESLRKIGRLVKKIETFPARFISYIVFQSRMKYGLSLAIAKKSQRARANRRSIVSNWIRHIAVRAKRLSYPAASLGGGINKSVVDASHKTPRESLRLVTKYNLTDAFTKSFSRVLAHLLASLSIT